MDDDGINAMSIDNIPETEVSENETGEFEEMASDLDWYKYNAHKEEAFDARPFQGVSMDGPIEAKLSNTVTDDPALEASLKIFQYAKKKGVSREDFDGIIGMVNSHIKKCFPKAPFLYSDSKLRD
ncbi:hypothetical protein BCV72DRAFT_307925 [Rhizopus microsporus var. microsporus]|uniref:Uncharacterized protein n=2 Tax=Rhizopus microsporus TaxID=58291 RepID=A0A2G4T0L4_RHIZD|nr:uncharacterized protein RHIMIDRAFT_304002 [Rhizopus microsporus ATCC 52813]ORE03753.1 hypothetical protein BCV72DRAFT_307925 [Rhizopus microsporus var. microsporus]PHZ14544.1 hypothetical protein RHIMIDRAFT_304002 [Rhizopus microsporus ATCC 52813]